MGKLADARICLGLGLNSRAQRLRVGDIARLVSFIRAHMMQRGIDNIDAIASLEKNRGAKVLKNIADIFGCPVMFFTPQHLEQETSRLERPSKRIFTAVGCHGVAEAAALAAAGADSLLVLTKIAYDNAFTIALAASLETDDNG